MPRPRLKNAPYFPQRSGWRNQKSIRALRVKFGPAGYGYYMQLRELIAESDYLALPIDNESFDDIAGDLMASAGDIIPLIEWCVGKGVFHRFEIHGRAYLIDLHMVDELSELLRKRGVSADDYRTAETLQKILCAETPHNRAINPVNLAETTGFGEVYPQRREEKRREEKREETDVSAQKTISDQKPITDGWEKQKHENGPLPNDPLGSQGNTSLEGQNATTGQKNAPLAQNSPQPVYPHSTFTDFAELGRVMKSEERWLVEGWCMREKFTLDQMREAIDKFTTHLTKSQDGQRKSLRDAKTHFANWFRSQGFAPGQGASAGIIESKKIVPPHAKKLN